jgi:hypothetical protein
MRRPGHRRDKDKWRADPGGAGHEIAREVIACDACARVDP